MKSSFRLPAVLACAASVCLSASALAQDDMAARRTQAEELLRAMHTEQILNTAAGRVSQMVDKYAQSMVAQGDLPPEQKAAAQKAQEEAHATISEKLNWNAVKTDFVQTYADTFSEPELKDLTTFYASPAGQKLVEKQPEITEKMGKLTQQKMMAVMPGIMQKIKDATQKPTPPPAPGEPEAPMPPHGVPPVPPAPTVSAPLAPAPSVSPAPATPPAP